jgi:DNA-binding response OmpR family regulator
MFRDGEFDLVLMDVDMPEQGGLEATRAIRRLESEAGRTPVPILAVGRQRRPDEIHGCLDAGCDDHLAKPVSPESLLAAVQRHAPKHHGRLLRVDGASVEEIDLYLPERHNDLAGLRFALEAEDLESVRAVARELESSGLSQGFAELASLGRDLEHAADAGDLAAIEACVAGLGEFLREVKIIVG